MAHFAKVADGIVTQVLVISDSDEVNGADFIVNVLGLEGEWIQTSYNTFGNQHKKGGVPLHKNFAGVGFYWDGVGFYAPQPFPSWTKNSDTYLWEAPKPRPNDDKFYYWDESLGDWVESETL